MGRGLDKYEEKETGIFVARVVPGGQAAKFGVKENDKIISINNKTPRNVDDAVGIIKDAGKSIKLVLVRVEEVPDVVIDDNASLASDGNMDASWMRGTLGMAGSRTGSVRSFNTNYGRQTPEQSPKAQRSPKEAQPTAAQQQQQQQFLREQEEYRRQQQQHRAQLAEKDNEIQRLLDELSNQLQEYQNLMDTKIALDMEIAVFRRLLESEEDRLGIAGPDALDDSFDEEDALEHSTPEVKRTVTTNSESNFQRKITVSQTQL